MQKIAYKLKHKATGLFYDPRGRSGNVSKIGRVFSGRKPPRQSFLRLPNELCKEYKVGYETELDDWVVVEYELKEIISNDN